MIPTSNRKTIKTFETYWQSGIGGNSWLDPLIADLVAAEPLQYNIQTCLPNKSVRYLTIAQATLRPLRRVRPNDHTPLG